MDKWGRHGGTAPARILLTLYLAALAFVAFWPTPVDRPAAGRLQAALFALHHAGLPDLVDYSFVEFSSNILLFTPIGVLAALAFPVFHRGRIVLAAFLASCGMELGQKLFLHDRFPSAMDIVANSAGAMLGLWVLGVVEEWVREGALDKVKRR